MGLFSTRNSDGASGKGEPVNTVPEKDRRGMDRIARQHDCGSRSELFSAGSSRRNPEYDPKRAGRN